MAFPQSSRILGGVYIGDTFYIANSDAVLAFDMKNGYEKTGELRD